VKRSMKKLPKYLWRFQSFYDGARLRKHLVASYGKKREIRHCASHYIPNLWEIEGHGTHYETGFRTQREAYDEAISRMELSAKELIAYAKILRKQRAKL